MKFWIRLYYALGLRRALNRLQRWLVGEHKLPRAPLLDFDAPGSLVAYVGRRFEWRKDSTRLGSVLIPLDYSTHPEVFQALLQDGVVHREGDCDDFHTWAAHTLLRVPGVEQAMILICMWRGGGHTSCVYRYKGQWYLLNYRITAIRSPESAPPLVFSWAKEEPLCWFFEDLNMQLLKVG